MVELIIGAIAVGMLTFIAVDLLQNSEIFDDVGPVIGNGRLSPYERIEALSCDSNIEFTEKDEERCIQAVLNIQSILGANPIQQLYELDANERINIAQKIHQILCNTFMIDLDLQMGISEDGTCGEYRHNDKMMWVDYRYLLSTNIEYIEEYFDTIVHEFRHAMQMKFIENPEYNGSSEDYRMRMACSLHQNVYVSYNESPELYNKQLCERDAREFASQIICRLKGEEQYVRKNDNEHFV